MAATDSRKNERDLITEADGFVVVSIWTPARYESTRHTYDWFQHLEDAVAYHRALRAGKVTDYTANGIFAARDGLPVGGKLDVAVIDTVMADPHGWRRPWHQYSGARSSPENKQLAERAIFNGDAPAVAS
jgi:hypothetical protein